MKTCTVCKEELDYSHYHNSKASKDGYGYRCKECDYKARASYKLSNKERYATIDRNKHLKHRYGITIEDYDRMLKDQGGCCAICGISENTWAKSWSVDHCHRTGKVRGLLCNQCNRGLGMLGDTKESLQKALNYLDTH